MHYFSNWLIPDGDYKGISQNSIFSFEVMGASRTLTYEIDVVGQDIPTVVTIQNSLILSIILN